MFRWRALTPGSGERNIRTADAAVFAFARRSLISSPDVVLPASVARRHPRRQRPRHTSG